MADFWVLRHGEFGPIKTFLTKREANDALRMLYAVVRDHPERLQQFTVEPFDVAVEAATRRD